MATPVRMDSAVRPHETTLNLDVLGRVVREASRFHAIRHLYAGPHGPGEHPAKMKEGPSAVA
jgi:hypothetical protein